jgi:hypothetical protein
VVVVVHVGITGVVVVVHVGGTGVVVGAATERGGGEYGD